MQNNHYFIKAVAGYSALLQRYARRLVQDESTASNIVQKVLESQYELNALLPCEHLRQVLKADVLNHCYYYLQARIFDRPLIKTTVFTHPGATQNTEGNKKPLLN